MDRTPLVAADGLELHWQHWPAAEPARGTVLLVHGLGEHIGRYAALVTRLAVAGWHVVGYDQRGHGWSPGPRGALPGDDALLADLGAAIDHVRGRLPAPLVLLGHSLGGLVAARYVAGSLDTADAGWWRGGVDALVLSSPALAADLNPLQKLLLATLGRLAPDLALNNGLNPAWISRDPAVVEAYVNDAQVHDRITPRLARFIVEAGAVVRTRAARWPLPTLLLWAGADRCVAPRGSREFADAAPPARVESHCFEPLAHEIFNEPERGQVQDVLLGWLSRHAH
ncbi:MAG TPA: lysophospholipase [Ideonella sp.]|nr:lysophospholipase [Ideonella sp.]